MKEERGDEESQRDPEQVKKQEWVPGEAAEAAAKIAYSKTISLSIPTLTLLLRIPTREISAFGGAPGE